MSKLIIYLVVIFVGLVGFSACSGPQSSSPTLPAAEKTGETQLSGMLFVQSERIYLKDIDEKPQETIEVGSYSVDLKSFSGKKVQVVGQYSGDTLFISKIVELE